MEVYLGDIDLKAFPMSEGEYTLKIINTVDKTDKNGMDYILITFINNSKEVHNEAFYPDSHANRLKQLAGACGCFGENLNTKTLVGCYIRARIDVFKKDDGEYTKRLFVQNIRPSNRRKDTTGSTLFSRKEMADERKANMLASIEVNQHNKRK